MREKLSDVEIQRGLGELTGWSRKGNALTRTVECATFPEAIELVNDVAGEAERRQHHPDIDIRFTKVTFGLSTHDAGGVTKHDLDLGKAIDTAVERLNAG